MRTIETTATVEPGGILTVRVPPDVPEGDHHVVIVIEEQPLPDQSAGLDDFPVLDVGPWPEGLSLRREDVYDDWGR